jgi:hypothetical protein
VFREAARRLGAQVRQSSISIAAPEPEGMIEASNRANSSLVSDRLQSLTALRQAVHDECSLRLLERRKAVLSHSLL